jgi:hypothetical protein
MGPLRRARSAPAKAIHLRSFLPAATASFILQRISPAPTAATARLLARLRLAHLRRLRHLHRARRWPGLKPLTTTPGYDAEATISSDGK